MARVEITSDLREYFPELGTGAIEVEAATVAEAIAAMDRKARGFSFYVCDETGRLRQHVNVFIDEDLIVDRLTLADALGPDSRVFIARAFSGG